MMADHGTVILLPVRPVVEVTGYGVAGATPCPPPPGPPTTGQIWPRGQGWDTTVDTSTPEPEPGYGVPEGTTLTTLTSGNNPYPGNTFTSSVYTINGSGTFNGWRFRHRVEVQAGTVDFINCLFEGAPADTTSGSKALLLNPAGGTGTTTATNCTFNPASPYNGIDGIRGDRLTLDWCEITRTVDGGQLYGVGSVAITNSWIHDLTWYDDGSHADGSHNDGFQILSGSNILIQNNVFDGSIYNAGLYVQQSQGPVSNLSIIDNVWDCEWPDAHINIYDAQGAGAITGLTMTGNVFRHASPADYQMLVSGRTKNHASTVISGNVWDDGSLPPPPVNTGALE